MTTQRTWPLTLSWIAAGAVVATMATVAIVSAGAVAATETETFSAPEIILKTQRAPEYPPAAKAARISGVVMVEIDIDKDGKVGDVDILECTHPKVGFEDAAAKAVKKWRFQPAQVNDEPLESTLKFRLTFNYAGVAGPSVSAGGISGDSPSAPGSVRRTDTAVVAAPRTK